MSIVTSLKAYSITLIVMGFAAISTITVLLLTTDIFAWTAIQTNSTGHRFLGDPSFSRFDSNFNSDNNASLYLPRFNFARRSDESESTTVIPAGINETSGRALDLDALLKGSASSNEEERDSGDRESRIVNDGSKHEIQGFIPIISLKQSAPRAPHPPPAPIPHPGYQPFDSYESVSHAFPQPQPVYPGFMGEAPPKRVFGGIGAAIQSLKMKRKQGYENADLVPGRDCLCVPFYMCKNGFLEGIAKNAAPGFNQQQHQQQFPQSVSQSQAAYNALNQNSKEYFDQQVAAAQAELAASIPPNFNPFNQQTSQRNPQQQQQSSSQSYPQPVYDGSNMDQSLPLDERSIDPPSESAEQGRSTHFPHNASDASESVSQYSPHEARMLGMGGNSCGVLRTCCRFAPDAGSIPPPSGFGQNGFIPQPYQPLPVPPVPQSPFFRPQLPKRPVLPSPGSFEILSASLLKPKSVGYGQPPYGMMQQPQFNKPYLKPPTRRLVGGPNYGPIYGQRALTTGPNPYQSIPQPLPSFSHNSIGHSQPVSYGQCGARSAVSTQGRVQNLQYHEASAEFGEYPWQAALLKRIGPQDSLYVCGGVLISPNFILTAAHCIKENRAEDLKVRLGEWDVHRDDEFYPYVERFVQEIIIHPDFFPGNLNNDIAVIRLESPLDMSSPHIAAACLPESFDTFVGQKCWVTGWGKNSFGHQGEYQSVLKEVDLPIQSNGECEHNLRRTRLGPYYQLFPGFLCAGGERGKDACEGDGGSPLVCEVGGGNWKVAGLVSWGIGCGTPGVPGVYANVAYYRQWIDSIVSRYGRSSQTSESFENNAYAPAGIIQERSNDGNDTIIATSAGRSIDLKKLSDNNSTTTSPSELPTASPLVSSSD